MATVKLKTILTVALLGACLSGCSALTAFFQGTNSRNVTAASNAPAVPPPASNTSIGKLEETTIPRLTDRAGSGAHDAVVDVKDLWDRIRMGFKFSDAQRPEVQREIEFYASRNQFIERTTERARPYLYYIVAELDRRQMPLDLALLPVVESAFRPNARSRRGAVGMWQFIGSTGRRFGLERNKWYDGRRDVIASTDAALDYLQQLHDQFNGDWLSAIAAYNCGEKKVERAVAANIAAGKPTDFWSLDLPSETTIYVPRLLALTKIVSSPLRYNLRLAPIANEPYLAIVDVPKQIDLGKAAAVAGVASEEMRALNPGYLKTVTVPSGLHKVVVPLARAEALTVALNARFADLAPSHKRAIVAQADTGQREHRVEKGESLSVIAERYDVTVEALTELNDVNPKRLKLGQTLLVPVSAGRPADSDDAAAVAGASGDAASPPADATRTVHTVRAGDSLWTIARSHDVRVKDLVTWNPGLTPKSVLQINQKIVVVSSAAEDAERVAETTAIRPVSVTLPSDGTFKLVRYQIQYGDSLWTIAQRFKVSIDQLRLWNGLPERSVLQPGDNIDVYVVSTDRPDSGLQI